MQNDYPAQTRPGFLISFEGGEGAGKTTQISRLRTRLEACDKQVVVLREPGGTPIAEQIREVVLSAKNVGIAYTAEVLLFQAARAQLYREVVLPSLEAGKIVLMDRTRDSSVVYQGIVRGFGEELIEQLNDISTKNTYPDVTFFLDVDPAEGIARRKVMTTEEMNRLDMESLKFHESVREAYSSLVAKDTRDRWVKVDAGQAIDDIEEDIWVEIQARGICA
jgi:dTMP kinase